MTWGLHFYIFLFLSLVFFSSSRKICVVLLDEVWFQYDSRCFICKDSVIRSVLNTWRICLSLGRMMWWAPTGHSIRKRLRWCILWLLHGNRQLAQLENIILKSPASFALVNLKGGSSLPEPIFSFPFFFGLEQCQLLKSRENLWCDRSAPLSLRGKIGGTHSHLYVKPHAWH
jgi:hypothetical protein